MTSAKFPPVLLALRPRREQLLLAGVVPLAFGLLCGGLLSSSGPAFLALQALAVAGGFWAGLEHATPLAGLLRGVVGGTAFGSAILAANEALGGADHGLLPDVRLLQVVITAAGGALLGALGAWLRSRGKKATSPYG